MRARLPILLLTLLAVGCAHTVQYKLTDSDRWHGSPVDSVLRVNLLADQTTPTTETTIEKPPYTWRTNYRSGYRDKEIANAVTEMVIAHLRYSGLFKDVVNQSSPMHADLELNGSIADFTAQARVNRGAEDGVMISAILGSVVGVLITSAAVAHQKSEIRATVGLDDLTLRDAGSTNVFWHDTITVSTNFNASWTEADEDAVFKHADNCLKAAVAQLVDALAGAMKTRAATSP